MNILWNYYKDGVTQSFIRKFRECKHQCYLSYVLGITRKTPNKHFIFGSMGHYVLEKILYKQFVANCYDIPTIGDIFRLQEEFVANEKANGTVFDYDGEEFNYIYHHVAALLSVYFEYYKLDTNKYCVIDIERYFKIPFEDTYLCGKLDVIMEDANSNLLIMDHKFLWSQADILTTTEVLPYDIQCNLYSYSTQQFYGKPVFRIIYDIIKKSALRPKAKELPMEYGNRVWKEANELKLRNLVRIPNPIMQEELENWVKRDLRPYVKEIKTWFDNGFQPQPVNDDALITKYGKCEHYDYIVNGLTHYYTMKTKPFEEL